MNIIFRIVILTFTYLRGSCGLSRGLRPLQNRRASISDRLTVNYFIGSQSIVTPDWARYRIVPFDGLDYSEKECDMLAEFRNAAASTRMNQFKFKFNPTSCESYQMECANKDNAFTLSDLAKESEMVDTFSDSRLEWYFMWVNTFNLPKALNREYTDSLLDAEYEEMYEWAVYMLKEYEYTNKVFFVGHWEGDWALMIASGCNDESGFDFDCVPSEEMIDRYTRWSQVRQAAIDDAKAHVKAEGVDMFHYIEFNLGTENYENNPTFPNKLRPTILNSVVPSVNPDFLSFSSYKMTNAYIEHQSDCFDREKQDNEFWELLNYAESKLGTTQTNFSVMMGLEKRVFVGEFGQEHETDPTLAATTAAQIFRAALAWGCPFILHWAVYDNESTVPLVPRDNGDMFYAFSPTRQLFKDWIEVAKAYLSTNETAHNDLQSWAVSWFDAATQSRRK